MEKRYWLSGGIVGFLAGIISWILWSVYQPPCDFYLPTGLSGCNLLLRLDFYKSILMFFVIGAILGWIYGKITNRNIEKII